MKATIEQITNFRSELEREMRALNGPNGEYGITEAQIEGECWKTSDEYIGKIVEEGTSPKEWAEFVTT